MIVKLMEKGVTLTKVVTVTVAVVLDNLVMVMTVVIQESGVGDTGVCQTGFGDGGVRNLLHTGRLMSVLRWMGDQHFKVTMGLSEKDRAERNVFDFVFRLCGIHFFHYQFTHHFEIVKQKSFPEFLHTSSLGELRKRTSKSDN